MKTRATSYNVVSVNCRLVIASMGQG